jgi:hypothetical protein
MATPNTGQDTGVAEPSEYKTGVAKPNEVSSAAKPTMLADGVAKPTTPPTIATTLRQYAANVTHAEAFGSTPNDYDLIMPLAGNLLKRQTNLLSHRSQEATVKKLFADITKLREWQSAAHPTHQQRDAMTKLGLDWHVPQTAHGKRLPPHLVAWNLEKEFMHTAQRLLENKTPFGNKRCATKPVQDDDAVRDNTDDAKQKQQKRSKA